MFCCNSFKTEIDLNVDSPNSYRDVSVHVGWMYTLAPKCTKVYIGCYSVQDIDFPSIEDALHVHEGVIEESLSSNKQVDISSRFVCYCL